MLEAGRTNALAPTIAPLAAVHGLSARAALQLVARSGFRHVQLSAAMETLRPRDLGHSARRDLLALLRRMELEPAGVDLWIPENHFTDPAHVDRAAGAVLEAVDYAADLGHVPLSICLPTDVRMEVLESFRDRADVCAVAIADHNPESTAGLSVGVDPAVDIMLNLDPPRRISNSSDLAAVRLSDASRTQRVVPGSGRLDLLAMQVALATCSFTPALALDLRALAQPREAMIEAHAAWKSADPLHAQ